MRWALTCCRLIAGREMWSRVPEFLACCPIRCWPLSHDDEDAWVLGRGFSFLTAAARLDLLRRPLLWTFTGLKRDELGTAIAVRMGLVERRSPSLLARFGFGGAVRTN
ncbi:hypothetical protein ACLOJK_014594 [Asimina triloba]